MCSKLSPTCELLYNITSNAFHKGNFHVICMRQKKTFSGTISKFTFFSYLFYEFLKYTKFPLTPMGVLAPVSAQRDTPLSLPSTSAEIFRRTCLQSSLKKNLKNQGGEVKFSKKKSDQLSRQIRQF